MENASKALLIAGGALISILVITLFLYAFGKISEYQTYKEELFNVEDLAKFNEQFTVYDRKDLKGSDVLSLINKVIDYNEKYTTKGTNSTDSYTPINLKISFLNNGDTLKLTYDDKTRLFQSGSYTYNENSWKSNIEQTYTQAKTTLPRS